MTGSVTSTDWVVSGDGHIVEPNDLFRTRLPKHLRDRAFWEENFEIEPLVPGGVREFARVRTPGFEGWTVSRYRHFDGTPHTGDPERMLEDMDLDGIDAQLMHPNRSLFALYSDDHEFSIAHARVYNDYVVERYSPHFDRITPTAPIPLTDVADAVAEIERVGAAGLRAILLPAYAPMQYWSSDLEPVWAAVRDIGGHVFFHCATGGVKVGDAESPALKAVRAMADELNLPMDARLAAKRMRTQAVMNTINPQQIIVDLIAGGVPERYPDVHFCLIEFNAHWLASLLGGMDKAWVTGIGQDADWWLGYWDENRAANDQPQMTRMFDVNEKWPYPLKPSEYVQRQFHVQFQDDPVAIACRHITGLTTIIWGNDYPHAEGTFRGSQQLLDQLFTGVPDDERKAIVGGTLGDLLGLTPAA
jgi:predicted TIM-barrel fold metal-dependent hydrolase